MQSRSTTPVEVGWAGRSLRVPAGEPLHRCLLAAGLPVESPCGGAGRCGRCRVRFLAGAPAPTEADRRLLGQAELAAGWRLSCQHAAEEGLELEATPTWLAAPESPSGRGGGVDAVAAKGRVSLEAAGGLRTADGGGAEPPSLPLVERIAVSLPRAGAEESAGGLERLGAVAGRPLRAGLDVLRAAAPLLHGGGRVLCYLSEDRLLAAVPEGPDESLLGICLDLGTTTMAAYLLDLETGRQLAAAARPNPQASLGADVMTRLGHALRPGGAEELRRLALDGANGLLAELCRRAGVAAEHVWAAAVVGNTAMHHLFLGLPVEGLATAPYAPVSTAPRCERAADVGLAINGRGIVYLPPLLGGFAGSDIAAVLLAARLWEAERPVLALDLGTNGEVLLGDRTGVLAASAPAGPAFEGAGLSCGLRAGPGAVTGVTLVGEGDETDLALEVEGVSAPAGLCGSGAVDAVAALLQAGVLDASGRLRVDLAGSLPPRLAARLRDEGAGAVVLWRGEAGSVILSQADVRQLQLAKAAVRSACDALLAERGLTPRDLAAVLLAGAFGNYVRPESALAIGLLPPVPPERVIPVGNAAAVGGMLCLLSGRARRQLEEQAGRVRHVPLAARADFQERFLEATWFHPAAGDGVIPAEGARWAAAGGAAPGPRGGAGPGKGLL